MFWKTVAIVAIAALLIAVFGGFMAVGAGAISCTFNTTIIIGCIKTAYVMLGLRIVAPALAVIALCALLHPKK